jgi:hypothetical protein
VDVKTPFPSNVCAKTTLSRATAAGSKTDPAPLKTKVPLTEALEHPLSAALAVGAMAIASVAIAAIVKVFATVLCFMTNLLSG